MCNGIAIRSIPENSMQSRNFSHFPQNIAHFEKGDRMLSRKQLVIRKAHELFMERGFRATSIQDIVDAGGISKGTFYNYFPSKNELVVELFRTIAGTIARRQDELLVGRDPSDIEVFIKQIELQVEIARANKLRELYEEVMHADDVDLKQFIRNAHVRILRWYYRRFLDLFGRHRKPVLLDCAVMFSGILHQNLKYHAMANGPNADVRQVVRYSVSRLAKMVEEVSASGEQLLPPELLDRWLPEGAASERDKELRRKLCHAVASLKKTLAGRESLPYMELLDFIQDEIMNAKAPRKFLIDSVLLTLRTGAGDAHEELARLAGLVEEWFAELPADAAT
jgi:AcrR family transcriptional regulator